MVRVPRYLVGGGRQGNVDAGTLTVLRSSIPFVSSVRNPRAANGGSDAETIDDLKARAAITVRTQARAVTAADYEMLVRLAAPSIARVACRDATDLGRPGHVLVQVVPWVPADVRDFELLLPSPEVLQNIQDLLEPRRVLGAIMHVEPPSYLGVVVATRLVAQPGSDARTLATRADQALRAYLHPVTGGPRGDGWPFGHPLLIAEVHSVLQRVAGVAYVDLVRLIPADVVTGVRGTPADIVQPGQQSLLFCVGNEIEVRE
jgi:predicted phage baseplate assembly protein